MSREDRLPDDKESRLARKFDHDRFAHLRRCASESFERDDVSEGLSFQQFFSAAIRYEASAYGGGPLQRLVAKHGL